MEALNTYTKEMTLRERVTEILSEMKMTKAELAMKIQYSRSAVSQYLGNKYSSDPTEIESRLMDFVKAYEAETGKQTVTQYAKGGYIPTIKQKIQYFPFLWPLYLIKSKFLLFLLPALW